MDWKWKNLNRKMNQESFDKNNDFGVNALIKIMSQAGYEMTEYPFGLKDIDLKGTKGIKVIYFDAEVRSVWKENQKEFPYGSIHVPARKGSSKDIPNVYFVPIRADGRAIYFISGSCCTEENLIRGFENGKPTDEYYFDIPLKDAFLYTFHEKMKLKIEMKIPLKLTILEKFPKLF